MTEILYLTDPYLKEFDSTVSEIVNSAIILEQTAFYPQGGGQPCDTGKIVSKAGKEYMVKQVTKKDGRILHELDSVEGIEKGMGVHGIIDWQRRYKLMRYHTAAHVVAGVFNLDAGALITGNQLDVDGARIDFNLENFDKDQIMKYFDKCNELISKDLKISDYWLTRKEAAKDQSLFKLAKELPESIKEIHVLEIVGFDKQADAGTHVKSLKEIGRIEFVRADNKGKDNRRVYFKIVDS